MDVIHGIEAAKTDKNDRPLEDISEFGEPDFARRSFSLTCLIPRAEITSVSIG